MITKIWILPKIVGGLILTFIALYFMAWGASKYKGCRMTPQEAVETARRVHYESLERSNPKYTNPDLYSKRIQFVYDKSASDDEEIWVRLMLDGKNIQNKVMFYDCDIETWGGVPYP
jgi:hypothetical protein